MEHSSLLFRSVLGKMFPEVINPCLSFLIAAVRFKVLLLINPSDYIKIFPWAITMKIVPCMHSCLGFTLFTVCINIPAACIGTKLQL